MLKLLFVEDEPSSVDPVIAYINRETARYACQVVGFADAKDKVEEFRPDIVILDLLVGGGTGNPQTEGNKTMDFVWNHRFCPVVIYSAHPDLLEKGEWVDHPFVKTVQKGSGSYKKVEETLKMFGPHVMALQEAERFIHDAFTASMRKIAPYVFGATKDSTKQKEAILRCGRRRVAASMDSVNDPYKLASWEAYIFPPIDHDPLLGDVLRLSKGKAGDPESFRVVLTPSCDMVSKGSQTPKVQKILVAQCCSVKKGIHATLGIQKKSKLREMVSKTMLTPGYYQKVIPFPGFNGQIPPMMADLKTLELVSLSDIAADTTKSYVRVASLDSPFRELISWAYMNTACRPGLPERDWDLWTREIIDAYDS